jgi:hypothetical protein
MVLVFETFFCDGERIEIIDESVGTQFTCSSRTNKKSTSTHLYESVDFCSLRYIDGSEVNGRARSVIVPGTQFTRFTSTNVKY